MKRRFTTLAVAAGLCSGLAAVPAVATANSAYRTCANSVGGQREVVQTVPGLTCSEALTITKRSASVDGDDGNRFFLYSTYWQCVTIARPDDGQHTEFGCYENHANHGPAYVKVTIFTQAN